MVVGFAGMLYMPSAAVIMLGGAERCCSASSM